MDHALHLCRTTLMAGALAVSARANTVLYSTDGTATPGFNAVVPYTLGPGLTNLAMQFTATGTGQLSGITVAFQFASAGDTDTFRVLSDAAGTPGAVLDTITITGTASAQLYSGASAAHPVLTSGTAYWLQAFSSAPRTTVHLWFTASPLVQGTIQQNSLPPAPGNLAAFALATPEPSTFTFLAGASLVFLSGFGKYHNSLRARLNPNPARKWGLNESA